jgi:hypothetical protein
MNKYSWIRITGNWQLLDFRCFCNRDRNSPLCGKDGETGRRFKRLMTVKGKSSGNADSWLQYHVLLQVVVPATLRCIRFTNSTIFYHSKVSSLKAYRPTSLLWILRNLFNATPFLTWILSTVLDWYLEYFHINFRNSLSFPDRRIRTLLIDR